MVFASQLRPGAVVIAPSVSDKWALLRQMVEAAAGAWELSPELLENCHRRLVAREESVSTGMEAGIAVPHAAVEGLDEVVCGLALLPKGLPFDSLDQQDAQVVVMILVPKHEKLAHLSTLTEVARRLGDASFRAQLLQKTAADDVLAMWA